MMSCPHCSGDIGDFSWNKVKDTDITDGEEVICPHCGTLLECLWETGRYSIEEDDWGEGGPILREVI